MAWNSQRYACLPSAGVKGVHRGWSSLFKISLGPAYLSPLLSSFSIPALQHPMGHPGQSGPRPPVSGLHYLSSASETLIVMYRPHPGTGGPKAARLPQSQAYPPAWQSRAEIEMVPLMQSEQGAKRKGEANARKGVSAELDGNGWGRGSPPHSSLTGI